MHRKNNDSDNFSAKYNMETSKELFEDFSNNSNLKDTETKLEKNDKNDGTKMSHMSRKYIED